MRKRFIALVIILLGTIFIFSGCGKSDALFTNYICYGYKLAYYYSPKKFPAVTISDEIELRAYSAIYRNYIDFTSPSSKTKSIDEAFKKYDSNFFKNKKLVLLLKEGGAPEGKYDAKIYTADGILSVIVKYPSYYTRNTMNCVNLYVLELPNSEVFTSVSFVFKD